MSDPDSPAEGTLPMRPPEWHARRRAEALLDLVAKRHEIGAFRLLRELESSVPDWKLPLLIAGLERLLAAPVTAPADLARLFE